MIKINVTLRNITLFGLIKNQGMLNHIFNFVSLEKKIVGFTAYIKIQKNNPFGCLSQSNILLFHWFSLMMLEIVQIHV